MAGQHRRSAAGEGCFADSLACFCGDASSTGGDGGALVEIEEVAGPAVADSTAGIATVLLVLGTGEVAVPAAMADTSSAISGGRGQGHEGVTSYCCS